jgi:Ca-activated chloride channel family protein
MLAEDIKPNRLKRAHLAVLDFVQQLDGDRVGLMPFAGSAYLMCPLTLDYEAFEDSLSAVTTDIIPRGGTNIAAVIDTAVETLNNAANHKILIILTDGENLQGDAVKAAEEAVKQGLTIYTVGVGTSQGELIPVAEKSGKGFVKDQQGNFVTSRLDEKTLTAIAEKSGGLYVPLGTAGEGLETIYQQKLSLVPKEELAERRHKVPLERFEWPLAAALFCLILELLIGERKKARSLPFIKAIRQTVRRTVRREKKVAQVARIAVVILLFCLGTVDTAYCSKGEEAFAKGDYLQASEYYRQKLEKSPNDPELHYNYGTAAFKNNMFDDAVEAFTKALKSDDIELQKKAYFNRGNSYYQKGAEVQQADPETTLNQWKQALSSLQSALQLDPDNADAKHNREVIKKRLEELEKQQQQKQNDQNNQEQQNEKDQKDQQQDNADQQDKNQQQPKADEQQSDDGQEGEKPESAENKQDQEQQQPQAAENKDSKPDKPIPLNESPEKNKNPEEQAKQDALRQQLGKMTKEEAESLLNALKNEEGELNFVPSGRGNNENDIDKDW